MLNTSKRNIEIDILYTIGALLAVFGHSHPGNWDLFAGTVFAHIIYFIYTFHMPLFFAIAGYLLINSKSLMNKSYFVFVKEKAQKLLIPYVVISAIFLIPKGYLEFGNLSFINIQFLMRTFFSPRDNVWGHFWFLPVLFIFYATLSLFVKWIKRLNQKKATIILIFTSFVFLALYFFPIQSDWLGLKDICNFSIYMIIGIGYGYLYINSLKLNTTLSCGMCLLLFGISVGLYVFAYQIACTKFVISCFMLLSLLFFAKTINGLGTKVFLYISKKVFTIYIYSWIFQSFTEQVLIKLNAPWYIFTIVMLPIGILLPLLMSEIYVRIKHINCKFLDICLGIR